MIQAISPIGQYRQDPDYYKIMKELMSFGINPSGNKSVDIAKLEKAKTELIQQIQNKQEGNSADTGSFQLPPVEETTSAVQGELELQRLGAMTLAELNKLYHNL